MNRLEGRIQHYNWGGKTFLPSLLGLDHFVEKPFAEYWLGIHPGAPSTVKLGSHASASLLSLIQSDKKKYLGETVTANFKTLPFLLKILDVKDMLSIQVHPTRNAAIEGYLRENELGIPIDSPNRNYKDENHKPEIMVALSDFWLLHGFAADIENRIETFELLRSFKGDYNAGGIGGLYKRIMEIPQADIDAILLDYIANILQQYDNGALSRDMPDYWATKAIKTFGIHEGHFDRGIFSIYLFNILHLKPGEGIYQGAGLPHAYLEGQNIELMSNSDNVLRAGLTNKHVDIAELLSNIDFVPTNPNVIKGVLQNSHNHYPSKVPDFGLHSFLIAGGDHKELIFEGPSILMMISGEGELCGYSDAKCIGFNTFFILPQEPIKVKAEKDVLLFIATVPI